MEQTKNIGRRRFLSLAALTMAAAEFSGLNRLQAAAATSPRNNATPQNRTPQNATPKIMNNIKQINAGVLNIGYAELGPANGSPVILIHGWPYDINSYAE